MYHAVTFSLYLPSNLYFIDKQNKQFHVLFHYFGKSLPAHLLIWEIVNLDLTFAVDVTLNLSDDSYHLA